LLSDIEWLVGGEWDRGVGEMLNGWNRDRLSHCHTDHCESTQTLPLPHCPLWIHTDCPTDTLPPQIQTDCPTATLSALNPHRLSHCHTVHCESTQTLPLPHCPLQIHTDSPTATLSTANPHRLSHWHTVHYKSRQTFPLPHCSLQIPHGLAWSWTQVSATKGRRLSSWATVLPYSHFKRKSKHSYKRHVLWHAYVPNKPTYLFQFADCSRAALSFDPVLASTVCCMTSLAIWVEYLTVMWPERYSLQPSTFNQIFYLTKLILCSKCMGIYCRVALNMASSRNDYKLGNFQTDLELYSRTFHMTWQNCILLLETRQHHDPISRECKIQTGRYVALFLGTRNTCRESQVIWGHEPRLLESRQSAVHPRNQHSPVWMMD